MAREEQQAERRLLDLAQAAFRRGAAVYSDFLNLNELNIYHRLRPKLSGLDTKAFGGYESAERQMVAFFPDALVFCPKYPIACLKLTPLQERFAEKLTHRDYLGAVLNLGIDRSKLGDILVEETGAYLFCQDGIAQFICDNLTRIRHTSFCARQAEEEGFSYEPKLKRLTGTVASVRLDSLISLAFEVSRSSLKGLLEEGRVFVNGKLITSNGYEPREGDLVSVRGMGRFRYESAGGQSKKGRSYVTVSRYIG